MSKEQISFDEIDGTKYFYEKMQKQMAIVRPMIQNSADAMRYADVIWRHTNKDMFPAPTWNAERMFMRGLVILLYQRQTKDDKYFENAIELLEPIVMYDEDLTEVLEMETVTTEDDRLRVMYLNIAAGMLGGEGGLYDLAASVMMRLLLASEWINNNIKNKGMTEPERPMKGKRSSEANDARKKGATRRKSEETDKYGKNDENRACEVTKLNNGLSFRPITKKEGKKQ
jgi:hypothetical protein